MTPHLLLVPGLLCNQQLWQNQTEAFSGVADCRVADLAPHGSVAAMADAIVQAAPGRFALAGFSMGGLVALEVLTRAPGRITHLALLSTNAGGILPQVRQNLTNAIELVEKTGLDTYLQQAFPRYFAPRRHQDQALWAIFSGMAQELGPAVAVRQMRALLDYPGFAETVLAEIRCPVTLICGGEDQRTPVAVHAAMAGKIPGSQLRVVDGAGHFTPIEAPDAVSAALRELLQR